MDISQSGAQDILWQFPFDIKGRSSCRVSGCQGFLGPRKRDAQNHRSNSLRIAKPPPQKCEDFDFVWLFSSAAKRGGGVFKRRVFPIWTCACFLFFFVPLCPFLGLPDFSPGGGTSRFVWGFSR